MPPAHFHSFVSDYARSEAPPQETGYGVESSDLESEKEDDPANPAANAARRTKAARNWKLYAEFNGQLAIAAIPDNARGFKHWKDVVRADVAACSKGGSKAYSWILRVEDNNIPDDTLKVSKRKWEPLDAKIRAALLKVATGEIRTMFELLTEEEHVRHRRQISGAYMLRMVYRRFQTKNSLSQFYDYADLNKVTLKSDAHLEAFLQEWRLKLNGLERPEVLPPAARLEMFVRQLRGSALLKYDMEVYKRLEEPDPSRAYDTLVRNVERIIREQRNLRVQSQLGQGGQSPPALPAPAGTVCRFYTAGTCQKGDRCDMVHDEAAKKAHAAAVRNGTADAGKGGGRDGGKGAASGGAPSAKGGGKGQPAAKAAAGPNGRRTNTKGGNEKSHLPCYANHEGKCKDKDGTTCRLCHRLLTPDEVTLFQAWKTKSAGRAASPGAPASGVCPEFLKGTCALGALCAMEHPEGPSKNQVRKAAKAAAKAAAGP